MTSLMCIWLLNLVSNVDFAYTLNHNRQDEIQFFSLLSMSFAVENFRMPSTTLAHSLTNYHVSQCGYWNADNADT